MSNILVFRSCLFSQWLSISLCALRGYMDAFTYIEISIFHIFPFNSTIAPNGDKRIRGGIW